MMRMPNILKLCIGTYCFFILGIATAGDENSDAYKIADIQISSNWKNAEANLFPDMLLQIESQFKAEGVSERELQIFEDELHQVFRKDTITSLYARLIAERLSNDEQRQTLTFFQTKAGEKMLGMVNDQGKDFLQATMSLYSKACDAALSKLRPTERVGLYKMCNRF